MRGLTIDAGGLIAFERRKREAVILIAAALRDGCLLYTSPSPRD